MVLTLAEKLSTGKIFWILVMGFGIFYSLQIPLLTSNSDVVIYSLRAKSDAPILQYAFYEKTTYGGGAPLPNYHVAHTVALWLVYQLMPEFLQNSIWPSGSVSALSAAFSIGIIFLIWLQLGLAKNKACLMAVVYGFIPTIWHHATIGEVYSLQYLFVYLFLLFFLKNKIIPSALSFALANLVSPISALSFSLVMIGEKSKKKFLQAFMVGFLAIALYLLIVHLLRIDPFKALEAVDTSQRDWLWRFYKLFTILLLNVNLFLLFLFLGMKSSDAKERKFTGYLLIGIAPYILLALYDSQFLAENGSFLFLLFWACAYFIVEGLAKLQGSGKMIVFYFFVNFFIYLSFWQMADLEVAVARNQAAFALKESHLQDTKIIGSWSHAVGIIIARDGWALEHLTNTFIDISYPTAEDMRQTGEDSLLLVYFNREHPIAKLSKTLFPSAIHNRYDPLAAAGTGVVEEKYRDKSFIIYLWRRNGPHGERTSRNACGSMPYPLSSLSLDHPLNRESERWDGEVHHETNRHRNLSLEGIAHPIKGYTLYHCETVKNENDYLD